MTGLVTTSHYAKAADLKTARERCSRLCQMEPKDAIEAIRELLYKMTLYRGQAPDQQYLIFTAKTLYEEILADKSCGLAYITMPEMEYAVKQAVLHNDLFIAVASVFAVLEEYARGEGHEIERQIADERKQAARALPADPRYAALLENYTNKMTQNSKLK